MFLARLPLDWTVLVEDESIFMYDVKIRKVWVIKGSKPVVLSTGSHEKTVWFGSIAENKTQLFRQYAVANSDAFLDFLKKLCAKYPRLVLFIDRAPWHKEERVKRFFRKNRHRLKVRWLPRGFPELNPVEECWNCGKDSVLGSTYYNTFRDFQKATTEYYRANRFKIDIFKYLCQ